MGRILRRRRLPTAAAVALVGASGVAVAAAAVLPDYVGRHLDGTAVATYGWKITPAGKHDVATKPDRKDKVAGLIPTGWYPTTVTLTHDGSRLLVTNAKGLGAGPNPGGPNPYANTVDMSRYAGSMITGTLSDIAVPAKNQLVEYTKRVHDNDRFDINGDSSNRNDQGGEAGSPVPARRPQPDQARDLHREGEPHLRPGLRVAGQGQRRPVVEPVR